jgi:signal transduction histidine kinase
VIDKRLPRGLRAATARVRAGMIRRRARAFDVAVAAGSLIAEFSLMLNGGLQISAAGIGLTAASGVVLLARRRAPLAVLALTLAAATALAAMDQFPAGVPVLVALFTAAECCDRRVSLIALAVTAPVLAIDAIIAVPPTIGVWALGRFVQTRRRYVEALEQRAAQLEREREQLARIAVHEERASIARELHDIVAHSVGMMLVAVRGARHVLRAQPDVAEATLARVETSGEQSMAELRRILALLRDADDCAESSPQPSLAELGELVAGYRDAGLPVRVEVTGEPRALPGGVELSVYRIVQEALTNVLKHGDARGATITLAFQEGSLGLEVVDDGATAALEAPHQPPAPRLGHGIVGMRERAALLGGELEAGPLAGGGFRVAARLPVGEST